ncbi:hypothetical protein WICPIJ_007776 [Wickerhamomyces pijperi]|uniref:Uncharacterized protein n=1 Tax=Wickerhamomyces pijperi TaxID=599730 RepID=A0A9P8TJL7_WICPI|nr:hypothetical protein WICPIJ_007776 [Wickerhamomyces pijperi]
MIPLTHSMTQTPSTKLMTISPIILHSHSSLSSIKTSIKPNIWRRCQAIKSLPASIRKVWRSFTTVDVKVENSRTSSTFMRFISKSFATKTPLITLLSFSFTMEPNALMIFKPLNFKNTSSQFLGLYTFTSLSVPLNFEYFDNKADFKRPIGFDSP